MNGHLVHKLMKIAANRIHVAQIKQSIKMDPIKENVLIVIHTHVHKMIIKNVMQILVKKMIKLLKMEHVNNVHPTQKGK